MFKKVKPIHVILICCLVLVWLLAVRRVIVYSDRSDEISMKKKNRYENTIPLSVSSKDDRAEFIYSRSHRNPFLNLKDQKQIKVEDLPYKEVITQPPRTNFSIEGIIYKKEHPLVVIKDKNNKTCILSVNDSIGEFIICDISHDSVRVKTVDDKFKWGLSLNKK